MTLSDVRNQLFMGLMLFGLTACAIEVTENDPSPTQIYLTAALGIFGLLATLAVTFFARRAAKGATEDNRSPRPTRPSRRPSHDPYGRSPRWHSRWPKPKAFHDGAHNDAPMPWLEADDDEDAAVPKWPLILWVGAGAAFALIV